MSGVAVNKELTAAEAAAQRAVGALIKRERERQGLTQTQYGELVGWTQRYVSKVEGGGVKMPRDATLVRVGKPLGLDLVDFYAARGLLPERSREPAPRRPDVPDAFLSDKEVADYCLNHKDQVLREQARRGKESMSPAAFIRNCRRTYRAHFENSKNIWGAALDGREPYDEGTFGPWPEEGGDAEG